SVDTADRKSALLTGPCRTQTNTGIHSLRWDGPSRSADTFARHSSDVTDTMLKRIIEFSLVNKFIVLLATGALVLMGVYSVRHIPLDAIPDLSDVQVIIYTEWPGQAPQIVQDQVTYRLTTKMLSVPNS